MSMDCDRDDVAALHARYAATRDRRARDELILHYDAMAVGLARRFGSRRDHGDDLAQVARIALIHAVDRFDVTRERPFVVYARATILGELKRHLRDHTWRLRPPRSLQEHHLRIVRVVEDLTQELGRSPRIPEVAGRSGLTEEQVLEAMEVAASVPVSLDAPNPSGEGPGLEPGAIDARFAAFDDRDFLAEAMALLPERDQQILRLRFEEELSQAEIGARLGVSQMCVSRALSRNLRYLRYRFDRTACHQ